MDLIQHPEDYIDEPVEKLKGIIINDKIKLLESFIAKKMVRSLKKDEGNAA